MTVNPELGVLLIAGLLFGYASLRSPDVDYRSSDGNWADGEVLFKGRRLETIAFNFEGYKLVCSAPNAVLVRTTARLWINPFAWPSYLTDRKWRVPYGARIPRIGNRFPKPRQRHCYNDGWSKSVTDAAAANAKQYLDRL